MSAWERGDDSGSSEKVHTCTHTHTLRCALNQRLIFFFSPSILAPSSSSSPPSLLFLNALPSSVQSVLIEQQPCLWSFHRQIPTGPSCVLPRVRQIQEDVSARYHMRALLLLVVLVSIIDRKLTSVQMLFFWFSEFMTRDQLLSTCPSCSALVTLTTRARPTVRGRTGNCSSCRSTNGLTQSVKGSSCFEVS